MFPGERRVLSGTAYRASERLHEGRRVEKSQVPFNIGSDVFAASGTTGAHRPLLYSEPIACGACSHHGDVVGHGLHGDVADPEDPRTRPDEMLGGLRGLRLAAPSAKAFEDH